MELSRGGLGGIGPRPRLDHIWVSPALKGALKAEKIIRKMRGWEKASDHVPVVAELDF